MRATVAATLILFACHVPLTRASDEVFPPSYDIHVSYLVSSGHVAVADTFSIRRTLVNNEPFLLSGLYFSDNLPAEFILTGQTLRVNGATIPFLAIGPIAGLISPEHDAYHWVVDSRGEYDGYDYFVAFGDTVELVLRLVCNQPGQYSLPAHTAVFLGNDVGFFAASASTGITVGETVSVSDSLEQLRPGVSLMSAAYPNPFNPQVAIHYSGKSMTGTLLVFSVFDLSGKLIERREILAEADAGCITWRPDHSVGSGIYLYNIVHGNQAAGGKVVLIK